MTNCLNCNQPLTEGQYFCPKCGQKAALKRLNLHDIWHDVVHYFTHADKGIFSLLKALVTQTGTVAREFVNGKRKKYFPPLNFFLIVAALYVFMGSVLPNKTIPGKSSNTHNSYQSAPAKPGSMSEDAIAVKKVAVGRFLGKFANFVAMFAAPFISLLIWIVYRKGPYNFTEHLVANLYLIGFTNLVRCMIYSPALVVLNIHPGIKSVNYVFVLFEVFYRTVFYYHFMGEFTTKGKFKSLGLALLTALAWWLLISGFIFVYIMMN